VTPSAAPSSSVAERLDEQALHASQVPWSTVVWNDPVNLMTYVSWVFRRHFGMRREQAEHAMLAVHHDGRATVAEGNREAMERHVEALHEYGLWATVEKVPR